MSTAKTAAESVKTDKWPVSARALLEERYKAFSEGNIDFIFESHHPETREQLDRASVEQWSKSSRWHGLEVHSQEDKDDKSFIRMTVRFERDFKTVSQTEVAEFRRHDGRWYYFDSEFPKPETIRRDSEKLGRNDPCHCGSGKKFKKCHG